MDLEKLAGLRPDNVPQIELKPLAGLMRYERNARTHSPKQVAQLEASLLEYGWTYPMLADEHGVVAGHGRIMAAENIYKRGEQIKFMNGTPIPIGYVPVIDCTGWTQEQRRAYIIADNALAEAAGWDEELLALELLELDNAEFDLTLTGLDENKIDELLASIAEDLGGAGDADPDSAPEAPEHPASQPGDIWVCGPHRVACGSATVPEDWDRLMGTERADAVFTDPPYNVNQGRKNREQDKWDGGNRSETGSIEADKMSPSAFREFLDAAFSALFGVMKAGAPIYVAHSDLEGTTFRNAFEGVGFHLQSCIVWKKDKMVLGRMDWQSIHEPILYGWKPGSKHRWYGGRKNVSVIDLGDGSPFQRMEDGRYQIKVGESVLVVSADAIVEEHPSSVLYEPKPAKSGLHPTQKPVALIERILKRSARRGDIIVDAFGGSGSTLIAADRLGMYARLMEVEPRFVDVIVRRWQQYTGRRAVHAVTREPFPVFDGEEHAGQSSGDGGMPEMPGIPDMDLF